MTNYRKLDIPQVIRVILVVTVVSAFIVKSYPKAFTVCYRYAMGAMLFMPLLVIWLDECQRPAYIAFGITPDAVFKMEEKTLSALLLMQIYLVALSIVFQTWTRTLSVRTLLFLAFSLMVYGLNVMIAFLARRRKVTTGEIIMMIACAAASSLWLFFPSVESYVAALGGLIVLTVANHYLKNPLMKKKGGLS